MSAPGRSLVEAGYLGTDAAEFLGRKTSPPEPIVRSPRPDASAQSLRLGVTLTVILTVAYFGFIGLSAFAPAILARFVATGGIVTWSFAYGLGVIVLGVVLTGLYVLAANGADARRTGA